MRLRADLGRLSIDLTFGKRALLWWLDVAHATPCALRQQIIHTFDGLGCSCSQVNPCNLIAQLGRKLKARPP